MDEPTLPVVVHHSEIDSERWADGRASHVTWATHISGDRTPTEQLTSGVVEIGPGPYAGRSAESRLHRHAPAEVYHVLGGEGSVTIDGVDHHVVTGSTIYIPPYAWHDVHNAGSVPLRIFYVFAVDSFHEVVYEFASE